MQDPIRMAKPTSRYAPPSAVERASPAELIRRHTAILRKVPGQEIEMIGNTSGSERVYIYTLPSSNSFGSALNIQLLFSIMAFDKRTKPVATLTLMENYERITDLNLLLALLDASQAALIAYLKRKEASLTAYTEINRYLDVIKFVIETVGNDMEWA